MTRPVVGQVLPRAGDAFAESEKWADWILAERGHGDEWTKVFRVGPEDADRLFGAIRAAIVDAPIASVHPLKHGVSCRVEVILNFKEREAGIRTIWHYADERSAPRLVTAYPDSNIALWPQSMTSPPTTS